MYEILQEIATNNSMGFLYARKDFANLYNEVESNQTQIILDPVQITESFGEYNQVESKEYQGTFMVLVSSDIDEKDYDYRYQTYIKPILEESMNTIKNSIKCSGVLSITVWRTIEIINILDYNMDGIVINYNVRSDG